MKLSAAHLRLLQEARARVNVSFVAIFIVIFVFFANSHDFLDDFSQKRLHLGHPLIQGILLFSSISLCMISSNQSRFGAFGWA